jgi:hypothetical protein
VLGGGPFHEKGSFGSLKYDGHQSIAREPEEWNREVGDSKTSIIMAEPIEALVRSPDRSPTKFAREFPDWHQLKIAPLRLAAATRESHKRLR